MSAPPEVKTEVTDLPDSKVKISASVPPEEVDRRLQAAARSFAGEMKVPGFRKGKVPPEMVLQRIGREAVMEEALREGLPEWYERALISSGVTPVGDPQLDMPEPPAEGDPLEFTIEVGVRPAAELGEYKGIEVPRPEPEVPAEAIDAEIERMRPIAERRGLTPLQLACQWNLAHPAVRCVVPTMIQETGEGARPIEDKRAELAALPEQALTEKDVAEIRAIGDNQGCMALKGATPAHEGEPVADSWPLNPELVAAGERWGVDPDRDLVMTAGA